eukprot:CAMPEP_0185821114 /NCGR_PEP_ID=MMETSP1322-20130828/24718_1 /TAXON_ID=265543 /ORGANISM="Minutocellus polymorphus, Strain RCC2270" /LENGTH=53 /DNA_ID=CAMNT_0028518473 /DNA_START=98 /DNA_END=255 /DNA_ORIENTATION=+
MATPKPPDLFSRFLYPSSSNNGIPLLLNLLASLHVARIRGELTLDAAVPIDVT